MKKSVSLWVCLGLLSSCGTIEKGKPQAADFTDKADIRIVKNEGSKLLRCYKKEYSRPHPKQKIKKIVVGIYESTTDLYHNFFQIKVTSKDPVLTANGKKIFKDFQAGGTCNLVMSPYPNPMNLDCVFTDDGADGSFGLYERSQDSKNKENRISLLKKLEIQKIMAEHVGDPGYSAILEVEDDERNRSYSLEPHMLNDCQRDLNLVLSE